MLTDFFGRVADALRRPPSAPVPAPAAAPPPAAAAPPAAFPDVPALASALMCDTGRVAPWRVHLALACSVFAIDSPARQAAWLAQVGHESGGLRWVAEVWGPTAAQRGYEGRADLGNTQPGDGRRYAGGGLIQITGRANYCAVRDGLAQHVPAVPDFEADPAALQEPRWAALSAAWYWQQHGLSALADRDDLEGITRRINGGLNGLDDRRLRWERAKAALGVA